MNEFFLRNKGLSFNDANLEPKFEGWGLTLFRAKILGFSCYKPNKELVEGNN